MCLELTRELCHFPAYLPPGSNTSFFHPMTSDPQDTESLWAERDLEKGQSQCNISPLPGMRSTWWGCLSPFKMAIVLSWLGSPWETVACWLKTWVPESNYSLGCQRCHLPNITLGKQLDFFVSLLPSHRDSIWNPWAQCLGRICY